MEPSDLSTLATLDALLQESSVSGAARRLGLSAPAVSHALARLRERFDDPLLVRAGQKMVRTPYAESLLPRVREAMILAERVFEPIEDFAPDQVKRTFTMSMTDYVLLVFGGPFDEVIHDQAPGLTLRVVVNAVNDAERLRTGETDLAVGIYGDLPPELKIRPIITDRFVCVVREDHPTIKDTLSVDQYIELSHIQVAPRGQPGGYVDEQLAEQGLKRHVSRAVPFFQTALEMTARSDRILTVPERMARLFGPSLGLRILEPPLSLEPFALSMVWHPRLDADLAHRWLREQLVEATQALDGLTHADPRRWLSPSDPTTGRGSK